MIAIIWETRSKLPTSRMDRRRLLLCSTLAVCGCASSAGGGRAADWAKHDNVESLRRDAQSIVQAFAAAVQERVPVPLGDAPTVQVRNTPQLIFFAASANEIVIPWWPTTPSPMQSVFGSFADGGDAQAEYLFRAFFNRFLVVHEAAHWYQARASRRERTLYDNENAANRLAVAFWRTQPDGEPFLAELEQLATRAAANLPDPTPADQDPVSYFGANYQALGKEPLKYGYYQFRFMRDALRERKTLQLSGMVGGPAR